MTTETKKSNSKESKSNTWCDHCTYTLTLECLKCKSTLVVAEENKRFVLCKCENQAILARFKEQEYFTGAQDTDATRVHQKRTGCSAGCTTRGETITQTLFQWQEQRQQFLNSCK